MDILVIGGTGLVGSNIVKNETERSVDIHSTHHNSETELTDIELDKTNVERTNSIIKEIEPDAVIDTAAFHAVDDCESNRNKAWSVNAAGTYNVAVATNAVNAHLIYLSTDYVFPGNPDETPYSEADPVSPLNYYAETKYAGEQAAKIADTATILRSSVIYGLAASNFVTWALKELEDGNEITIVDDQISTPTYAPDLAQTCLEVAKCGLTGLYHATGPQSISRYDFTRELADSFGYNTNLVTPISTEELGQEAPRPTDSSLDSSRLSGMIDYEFRGPEEAFTTMRLR
ncbi:dTDP-4-dehydrorhamnose reductase [Haloterrigena sp. SYSU A558-1]|uniref:dTDP-4-dehydrorhamnose reductase n=1 Tax=Haloterrigena gelatinilytica TaxID=2741724 RepID=A0ABX2L692_9EURY|nr:dTDP-4-dehydrorhamnose reductase [Haloterrigena gelatinilytica]NUC70873.1 dTDP-4-dehydrorhamnose reductase [Haloterrigena gelatinilytica]